MNRSTISTPNLLPSIPSKIAIAPERMHKNLQTTRSIISGRRLSTLKNPHNLRDNRVKSAYTFGESNDSKHTRKISSIYAEEVQKAKQKFLMAENFSCGEFNSALKNATKKSKTGGSYKLKNCTSLTNAGLAEILLISNDRNRECTLLANEQTNIDFIKKQKRLALEYKVNISKIDRDIEIWSKKLENLQNAVFDETPEMIKLRRHCQNRASQIELERSKSEHKLQRQQRIFMGRFYDLSSNDRIMGGSKTQIETGRLSRNDRRRVKSAIGF